jgi:hypothetical protein
MTSFKLEAVVDVHTFSDELTAIRLVGHVRSYCQFWFEIKSSKGRRYPVRKLCLDWDPEQDAFVRRICPYRAAGLTPQINYISNAIVRSLQTRSPIILHPHTKYERIRRQAGNDTVRWKERYSKSWTPIRVVRFPRTVAGRIQKMSNSTVKRGYDLAHAQYGFDLLVRYDKTEPPECMYELRAGRNTVLTEEELAYLRYPLDAVKPETLDQATREWARLKPLVCEPAPSW